MPTSSVPLVLSQQQLTLLVVSAVKVDLINDFAGAMLKYQLNRSVAEIILSLESAEIQLLAQMTAKQNVLRLANGNSTAFWTDLKQALANEDKTAVSFALVQSILMGVPSLLAA